MIEMAMGRSALEAALADERARLVRLCARLTGDAQAAEDLAQETLMEAWRALGKLRTPDGLAPWLTAIARNVCLRWGRARGRDLAHLARPALDLSQEDISPSAELAEMPATEEDELGAALERREVVALLDRALALLPAETRAALVGSYVAELPHAELAGRLGMSEGALRVRLHRGRQALKRALQDDLRADAIELGLSVSETPEWQETRIWCPFCGTHHLLTRIDRGEGAYSFRCSGTCVPNTVLVGLGWHDFALSQLTSPKSLLARHCLMLETKYRQRLLAGGTECDGCGRWVPVRQWIPGNPPSSFGFGDAYEYGIYFLCERCQMGDSATPLHLTLDTAVAQRFWRRHPRMRALPARKLDFAGRPALLTGFESVEDGARLELVSARDTYEILGVMGEGEA